MSMFNRRLWLVAAALSAAIAFVGILHPVSTSLKPAAATPAPKFAAGHRIVHSHATDPIIHNDPASRLFDDANLDDVCSRMATQPAYESQPGEAPVTASEPGVAGKEQLSRICAKKMISSDDEILSRMRDAANGRSRSIRPWPLSPFTLCESRPRAAPL